ncbi:MAG: hypothetical protein JXQ73_05815 [Phycisphaerae bacterium]|nr:hypothetical protein [Phycisphaerae bacterium]
MYAHRNGPLIAAVLQSILSATSARAEAQPVDVLIEAERFDRRVSTSKTFARPTPELDADTLALLAKPLTPVRPAWLDEASGYRLPAWYDACRVQAHTRLSPSFMNKEIFYKAAAGFREMGARVFVRHIKSGSEPAWWPSKVGAVLPAARDRNIAKEIIDNAHAQGCRIIVYHRHMEDRYMAEVHPDWVCRDWRGKALSSSRGDYMCFNSPYPDYFQTRAIELVDMGADGFYFDERHMPKTGCWCASCKKAFKQATGLDHPERADPSDPVWHRLIDFNNLTIERTFLKWRRAIHQRNPSVVMLIGSNTWPTIADRHMTNRLFRIADSMKTEFSLPARNPGGVVFPLDASMKPVEKDAKLALGYTLARDSADGRPAHIWTHGLRDETSSLFAVAGMITHGCIANLDVPENTIPNPAFKKAFALGEKVSPYFAGTTPIRWAMIHYPELARDQYATDPKEAWRRVLYPTYGAYLALLRARLPAGIVTDSQLEEGRLQGAKVLVLPAPDMLTEPMRKVVSDFKSSGGLVVENDPAWQWHDANGGQERAVDAFGRRIEPEAKLAPVRVSGGPERMHAVSFVNPSSNRLTVALTNDFSWVQTGRARSKSGKPETPAAAPPPCAGVRVWLCGRAVPRKVQEVVSGRSLTAKPLAGGIEIAVPDFDYLAVVVLE